jgi:hypothetical protein
MRKLLLVLALSALFAGCEEKIGEGGTYYIFLRSYVTCYHDVQDIQLWNYNYYISPSQGVKGIVLGFRGDEIGNFESTGAEKETYDALCEKYGDMTFNRDVKMFTNLPNDLPNALSVDFVSVDITSNADFDAGHLAGSSLGDIVMFNAWSFKPYIDSGYTSNDGCWIWELVSELTPAQLTLLEYQDGPTLWIQTAPTLSKTHTFTVTMTADDGRVFSDTIEMTFE